jgi:hypothetical protein
VNEGDLVFAWQVSLLSSGIYILLMLVIAITQWSYTVKFAIAIAVIKTSISYRQCPASNGAAHGCPVTVLLIDLRGFLFLFLQGNPVFNLRI